MRKKSTYPIGLKRNLKRSVIGRETNGELIYATHSPTPGKMLNDIASRTPASVAIFNAYSKTVQNLRQWYHTVVLPTDWHITTEGQRYWFTHNVVMLRGLYWSVRAIEGRLIDGAFRCNVVWFRNEADAVEFSMKMQAVDYSVGDNPSPITLERYLMNVSKALLDEALL